MKQMNIVKLLAFILAFVLYAQAQPKCDSFYAAGLSMNRTSSANDLAAVGVVAVPLTTCTANKWFQVYNDTQYIVRVVGSGKSLTYQTTISTGGAHPIWKWKSLDFFGLVNIGLTVNGKTSSITPTYGGLVGFPVCKCKFFGLTPRGLVAIENVAGMPVYAGGLGSTFGFK